MLCRIADGQAENSLTVGDRELSDMQKTTVASGCIDSWQVEMRKAGLEENPKYNQISIRIRNDK